MYQNLNRRQLFKQISLFMATLSLSPTSLFASEVLGNFKFIYSNKDYAKEFFPFLVNVFHLLPEEELHQLIKKAVKEKNTDKEIYQLVQRNISTIKPLLADITYALPALRKQKKIMASQTKELMSDVKEISGYVEIGSVGRYLDALEEVFEIENISMMDEKIAGFRPVEMIERGQILKAGDHLSFNNYKAQKIKPNSHDLITMFIGMHHCPPALRNEFLQNIRNGLRPNGSFIIRDHDAKDEKKHRIVSLAHDVFNMGTMETWKYNQDESRYFYSHEFLENMMRENGFKKVGGNLFQDGDPSCNALMRFQKA